MTYPLAALLAAAHTSRRRAQDLLRCSADTLSEAAERGVPERVADMWAVRLGVHPGEVWPDWFTDGLTAADAIFVESGWRTAWLWKEAS